MADPLFTGFVCARCDAEVPAGEKHNCPNDPLLSRRHLVNANQWLKEKGRGHNYEILCTLGKLLDAEMERRGWSWEDARDE